MPARKPHPAERRDAPSSSSQGDSAVASGHLLVDGKIPSLDPQGVAPELRVMVRHGLPALRGIPQPMIRHFEGAGINREPPLQADPYRHRASTKLRRDTVAVAPDIDIAVPADEALFPIRRIIASRGQRTEKRSLAMKPLKNHFLDGALAPPIRLFLQPPQGQLIHMLQALKMTPADKKVVLDVTDHPFVLPLGPGSIGTTGAGSETVAAGQVQKPLIEPHPRPDAVLDHRALVIIHEHLPGHTAEVLEGPDDPLIGMLRILTIRAPEVKPPRKAQGVDAEVNFLKLAPHPGDGLAPVALHLTTGFRLETDRCQQAFKIPPLSASKIPPLFTSVRPPVPG